MDLHICKDVKNLFYNAITETENKHKIYLHPLIKIYLVNLLEKHYKNMYSIDKDISLTELVFKVIDLTIFEKINQFKFAGDLCTIYSGLYPDYISQKMSLDYCKLLGRVSYDNLCDIYSKLHKQDKTILLNEILRNYDNIILFLNRLIYINKDILYAM
jgi:hypothetical protein